MHFGILGHLSPNSFKEEKWEKRQKRVTVCELNEGEGLLSCSWGTLCGSCSGELLPPSLAYPFRKALLTRNLYHICILKWKCTFLTVLRTLQLNGEDREMKKFVVIQRLNAFGNYLVEGKKPSLRVLEYSFDRFKSIFCLLCVCVGLLCNCH